jgi:hypothetical protein
MVQRHVTARLRSKAGRMKSSLCVWALGIAPGRTDHRPCQRASTASIFWALGSGAQQACSDHLWKLQHAGAPGINVASPIAPTATDFAAEILPPVP